MTSLNRFFQELKDRGVFRAMALYGALVWLLLQASDVLFPAFEIPDSAVIILLVASAVCFPFVLLFAWFYELTDRGIQTEEEVREGGATRLMMGNEVYFVIIGILALALSISIYMNIQTAPTETGGATHAPVSVLIADFENRTGDPIFDGSVEQALGMGIEGAPFISNYPRARAVETADLLKPGDRLGEERARLVAVREGVTLVLVGDIRTAASGFEMNVKAIDPRDGTSISEASATADNRLEVLPAVSALSVQIREGLGDVSMEDGRPRVSETFSTTSLRAVHHYTKAQEQAHRGRHEEAVELYEQAVDADPEFGRAWSGWALSEFQLGRKDKADKLWEKTLTLLSGMTDREKYRTLGLYYSRVTRNYEKAVENYTMLVEQYPADAVGHKNLAVSYFMMHRFDQALNAGRKILGIYPAEPVFRSNYALYAMYAGDFETAQAEAEKLLAMDRSFYKAYLPLAMARLYENDVAGARQAYEEMAGVDERGASVSATGLADVSLKEGAYSSAASILRQGIELDSTNGTTRFRAAKYIGLAEAYLGMEDKPRALGAISKALEESKAAAQLVPAGMMYVELGDYESARNIANRLGQNLQSADRAYASMIEGSIAVGQGAVAEGVDKLRAAVDRMDMWLVRLNLGKAYMQAGHYAEALSEFEICQKRPGEATALFLDDMPTFHYSVELYYWLGRAQQELGIAGAATRNLKAFLRHKSYDDISPRVVDARQRLTTLTAADVSTGE